MLAVAADANVAVTVSVAPSATLPLLTPSVTATSDGVCGTVTVKPPSTAARYSVNSWDPSSTASTPPAGLLLGDTRTDTMSSADNAAPVYAKVTSAERCFNDDGQPNAVVPSTSLNNSTSLIVKPVGASTTENNASPAAVKSSVSLSKKAPPSSGSPKDANRGVTVTVAPFRSAAATIAGATVNLGGSTKETI